jgi:O-antigen ligase
MSTSEKHFDEASFWENQDTDYFDSTNRGPEESVDRLPSYGTTSLPVMSAFMLYVVWWYLQGGYRFPALGEIRFEFLLGGLLSLIAVIKILQNRDNIFPAPANWALAFIILMSIMTVFSIDPEYSRTIFVDRVVKFIMMGVFIYAFVVNPLTLRWFLFAWLFAFAKMAQEGIVGWLFGGMVWENQGTMRLHGSTPNYRHPNSYSGTQLATLPFLYFLFPLAPRLLQLAIGTQIVAALLIVMTTGSRTGYVALAGGTLLLIWKSRSRFKALALVALMALLAAPYIPQDYVERAETIFTQQDEEGASIDARKQILEDAVAIFQDNLFGVGLSGFPAARMARFDRHQDTHNLYLEVLTGLGIQGFILFTGMLISLFGMLFMIVRRTRSDLAKLEELEQLDHELRGHVADLRLILATCLAVIGFLIIRLVVGIFGHDLFEVYWWFALGLGLALARMLKTATRRTDWFIERAGTCGDDYDYMADDFAGKPEPQFADGWIKQARTQYR